MKKNNEILGLPVIAIDSHGRPVVRDLAKRSYRVLEDGRFVPLHANPSRPPKAENEISQRERRKL